jgi:hypothetical protein
MIEDNSELPNAEDDNMLCEYDFTDGVRGKHYQAYRQGHTIKVIRENKNPPFEKGEQFNSSKSDKNYECRN